MSSNKVANNDSCRDLNGRRISTINKAKKSVIPLIELSRLELIGLDRLAEFIENAPVREAAAIKKSQDRLNELNEEIKMLDGGGEAGNKRRLEDNDFIEESRELVEGVRDAVKDGE